MALPLSTRLVTGPLGEYSCRPPWTSFELSPTGADLLGLETTTVSAAEVAAVQPVDTGIRYDAAIAETVRTGDPLVLTRRMARISDGQLRTFTTAAEAIRDEGGEPVALQGRFVDVTDEIAAGQDPATADCIALAVCGATAVVLTSGELDMTSRSLLADTMTQAVARGAGDVYVDAQHLRFCEVRTASLLADTARELAPHRQLVVLHPPRILRRILRTLDLDGGHAGPPVLVRNIPGVPEPT